MKTSRILVCLIMTGCAASRSRQDPAPTQDGSVPITTFASTHAQLEVQSIAPKLTLSYILKGECRNWKEALAIATKKMGCNSGEQLPEKCRAALPCDVCQFLKEGAWPIVKVVDFPAEKSEGKTTHILAAVQWDERWKQICPLKDTTKVEIKSTLCEGKGRWGFNKADTLAKALVHEALHLCRSTGARGAAMADRPFWEYLFCPSPDAEDLVELCWEPRN